ncbi:MAG: right-handed parallel beta-helix repeat-containing protein, partial [Anaerolineales bacterium]|nr:right-handed parallel beta-helix repeat-containing protein [Anaerolineales bacterium]
TPQSPSGTITTGNPTFTWTKPAGATQYALYVYTNATPSVVKFANYVTPTCNASTCSYTPTLNLTAGSYKWAVRAGNTIGWSSYSAWRAFIVFSPSAGKTYYVRPNGGDAEKCTGLANAAYPGSGTARPCAWDNPFRALPPGGPARIAGGDTLVIAAGSYMIGYGAPGAESDSQTCASDYPWACSLAAVPSGPDPDSPTRILGQGWDSGCQAPPELWGTQRLDIIFNLTDSSNVEVACLEITDHSGCVEGHTGGLACQRDNPPYGDWAAFGLYAEDSSHVHLQNLNIHGLASGGVHAGRLKDWTVENVRVAGNGMVGWDGDLWEGNSANSGTLLFRHWTVEWNGCGETYPAGKPTGCWGQEAGGYGDGVGTGTTGGHWIIEDSAFLHNTSDGLDLLYARLPDAAIEIRRTIAEGNAGNQVKTTGPVTIENSIIVGNCGFFQDQPFTFNVDQCRAYGSAVSMDLKTGNQARIVNTTLTSEGDCLIGAECDENSHCNGSEKILLRNNIFQGHTDFLQPEELTCLAYTETIPGEPFDMDYSIITNVKDNPCPIGPHDICLPPKLVNTGIDSFNAHLLLNSPAINAGTAGGAPKDDFSGQARDVKPDIGAYEWR